MNLPRFAALVAALALCVVSESPARGPSRETADWIAVHAPELEGRHHSVQVAGVTPGAIRGNYQWFSVFTYGHDGTNGSWIEALVPRSEADWFISNFGTLVPEYVSKNTRTRRLDGTVRLIDGTPYLEIGSSAAEQRPPMTVSRARTWTSIDGRTIEAEMLRGTASDVTIRRTSDGQVFTISLDKLSQADRDYVLAAVGAK